jgi:threonine/homoserine/homoserine lactone efflux protein
MELSSWISIAAVCATGAASPGPSLAVVVRNTVAGGRTRGVLTGLGHGIGVGIYAFGAVVGVSALVASNEHLGRGIETAGALYLLWMGIQTLRHAGQGDLSGEGHGRPGMQGFSEGFMIAFLNPKIAVFFLALLGSFLPVDAGAEERAGVAGLAMCIDGLWYMFAAVMLAGSGNGIWVDRALAALLFGVAAWLLFGVAAWLLSGAS